MPNLNIALIHFLKEFERAYGNRLATIEKILTNCVFTQYLPLQYAWQLGLERITVLLC